MQRCCYYNQVGIEQGEFVVYSTQDSDENITGYLSQVNGTYNVSDNGTEAELTRLDQDTIIATFSNGVGCTFTKSVGILNFVLALPRSFMGQTRGLLGNNNGNKTDDFVMRGTTHSLPDNLTEVQIFSYGKSCKHETKCRHVHVHLQLAIHICYYEFIFRECVTIRKSILL